MKKFITCMTLQKPELLKAFHYEAKGNDALKFETETSFPIMTAINGYVEKDEKYEVIVVMQEENEDCKTNFETFKNELRAFSESTGKTYPEIVEVPVGQSQSVTATIDLFQKLIEFVDEDDELFPDITYGTKPMSMSLLTAIRYANRLLNNVRVGCIVYGEVDRKNSKDSKDWEARVYDESAILSLDEITSTLARRGVKDPKKVIKMIIGIDSEEGDSDDE